MAKKRCCSICHKDGHNSRTCNVQDPPEANAAPEATSEDNHSGLQLNLTLGRGSSAEASASSQQPQPPELEPESNNQPPELEPESNNQPPELEPESNNQPPVLEPESNNQPPALEPESNNNNSTEVQINKGVRWSPEEHMGFLKGLQFLGKGAWKAISENYVRTRTANQISSHAQKYYKRMKNPLRRKRNPSIFDIGGDEKSQPACVPFLDRFPQISPHSQLQPNHRLHPLPPSPNPGTRTGRVVDMAMCKLMKGI